MYISPRNPALLATPQPVIIYCQGHRFQGFFQGKGFVVTHFNNVYFTRDGDYRSFCEDYRRVLTRLTVIVCDRFQHRVVIVGDTQLEVINSLFRQLKVWWAHHWRRTASIGILTLGAAAYFKLGQWALHHPMPLWLQRFLNQ